jgi:hypothetical protein
MIADSWKKISIALLVLSSFAYADLTVTSPANNANFAGSANVVASATPTAGRRISTMKIYLNSVSVYSTTNSSLNATVALASGSNRLQVKAWDTGGTLFQKDLVVHSGSSSSTGSTIVVSKIEELTGWGSCDTCAGANASGSTASYWMKQGVVSPSLDGNSAEFHLGGTTPYANAVWWKRLVTDKTQIRAAKHFVYDAYFYYTNSHAVQGLEFNISQYFDGKAFIYGMQCNVRNGAHWDVSTVKDYTKPLTITNMAWQNTGISCPAPPTYSWNHVTMEVERTADNKVHYISITLNGAKKMLDIYAPVRISDPTWMGVNVHYQMNGNYIQEDYSSWVDKLSLTYY